MPSIEVDNEVYEGLGKEAKPFTDTPNSVIRRLLGLDGHGGAKQTAKGRLGAISARTYARARPGSILPHDAYVTPILSVISEKGGAAASRDVVEEVGEILKATLTPTDLERLPSGWIRWENRVHWVRLQLVERGFLSSDSPRGIWSITQAGRAYLESAAK
jgi:hypothetical protein